MIGKIEFFYKFSIEISKKFTQYFKYMALLFHLGLGVDLMSLFNQFSHSHY
jgi:hypothetical protein